MEIPIGYSPCPNDTFIFNALVHQKIDTKGLVFKPVLADVELLNQKAFKKELPVTKLSYFALAHLTREYIACDAGSALGMNVGPLLVCSGKKNPQEILSQLKSGERSLKIAIPGKYTTANFLLSIAFPLLNSNTKSEVLFSEIEERVLSGEFDAGLVIHESRFTYAQRGLQKIMDCGEFWQNLSQAPIPLGGIAVLRTMEIKLQQIIDNLIKESVLYAFNNIEETMPYVREHAQEMDESVMLKHINLYVNDFTVSVGNAGREAVILLFNKACATGLIKHIYNPIFIPES